MYQVAAAIIAIPLCIKFLRSLFALCVVAVDLNHVRWRTLKRVIYLQANMFTALFNIALQNGLIPG